MVVPAASIFPSVPTTESIVGEAFDKFNFHKEPGLLQFWECITASDSEEIGCYLTLTEQTYMLTRDHEGLLQDYRRRCLESRCRFVGVETKVGKWLPGRAAQTRIADHRTIHHALNPEDQHPADIGGKGQLVLPPLSAKFRDLRREVVKRFPELKKQQELCVEYDDTEGNRLPISSDEGLQVCLAESSSRGEKFIRMCVISNT
ncbi:putative PB1 domain-containing protein [Helianthus annuus]|nr:putative PB1 domain-containing protein [Helianthus annuus]KAJ0631091.1 putative PB1 domain-containing protein [Helianthus annuus]KAJ0634962.1 putative PB1 domain-containing protein [Helianthus annuus]